MDIIELLDLLSISESRKSIRLKVVQLQLDQQQKIADRLYLGDADKFVHAKVLEEALLMENYINPGTERLHKGREVCAREGVGYKCLGMGLCAIQVIISKKKESLVA